MKVKSLMTAAVFLVLAASSAAYADTLSLRYGSDGTNWTTLTDVTIPYEINVSAAASVGIFNFVVQVGQGSPGLPPGNMDLTSAVRTDLGGTGMLFVELSQDNLTTSAGALLVQFAPVFTGSGLSVTLTTFVDDGNALFGKTTQVGSTLGPTSDFGAFTTGGSFSATAPFSVTERLVVNCVGCTSGTGFTSDALVSIPEPTSLILLGSGLASLALWLRRRKGSEE
jgi:hypothetical protein